MRKLSEVYQAVNDYIIETYKYKDSRNPLAKQGICEMVKRCRIEDIITPMEEDNLMSHFHENRPYFNRHPEFFDTEHAFTTYWWDIGEYDARIEFLQLMINECKDNEI